MPLNPKAKLVENILDLKSLEQKASMRIARLRPLGCGNANAPMRMQYANK